MKYSLVAVNVSPDFNLAEYVTPYKTYDVEQNGEADPVVTSDRYKNLVGGFVTLDNGKRYWLHQPDSDGFVVKKVLTVDESELDPVIKSWGSWSEIPIGGPSDGTLFSWLVNYIVNHSVFGLSNPKLFDFDRRIRAFAPMVSKQYPGKISIYRDLGMRIQDRQTAMKPGRAFTAMFPEVDHKQVIMFVDSFLNSFAKRDLKLEVSSERKDFKLAYSGHQAPMENIDTTWTRKSSSSSCMRYEFEHLKCHPAEVYASGDFEIVTVFDGDMRVAARCVVYVAHDSGVPQAGPIYGVSEQALDMIDSHLIGRDAEMTNPDWVGARLLAVPEDADEDPPTSFIGPYLDVEPRTLDLTSDEKYLVQDHCAEIDASNYQGIISSGGSQCICCGDRVHDDYANYSEHYERDCCEDCYNENHFFCEYAQESFHVDSSRTAYALDSRGRTEELRVSDWAVQEGDMFVWCTDHKNWHIDDVQYCEYEDEWISPDNMKDYFRSDWDGELYNNDMLCNTVDDEEVSREELSQDSTWKMNSESKWYKEEEEE